MGKSEVGSVTSRGCFSCFLTVREEAAMVPEALRMVSYTHILKERSSLVFFLITGGDVSGEGME